MTINQGLEHIYAYSKSQTFVLFAHLECTDTHYDTSSIHYRTSTVPWVNRGINLQETGSVDIANSTYDTLRNGPF